MSLTASKPEIECDYGYIPVRDIYFGENRVIMHETLDFNEIKRPQVIGEKGDFKVDLPPLPHDFQTASKIRHCALLKAPETNVLIPPHLMALEHLITAACDHHYDVNGFTTDDFLYLDIMQGLLMRSEVLNEGVGMHADIRLISPDGRFAHEDIYFASSACDTTYVDLGGLDLNEAEIRELRRLASNEFAYIGPDHSIPYQHRLKDAFLKAVNEKPDLRKRFGTHTLVNLGATTPHMATLCDAEEVFRTLVCVRFTHTPYRTGFSNIDTNARSLQESELPKWQNLALNSLD